MTETLEIEDSPVFSYPLASGDMRYIEIGERDIYLRDIPDTGLVFRGEIPGCGSECYVELNEILLEYAMSCEGCREESKAGEEVTCFGEHLGKILLANTHDAIENLTKVDQVAFVFHRVLDSMSSNYREYVGDDKLEYSLDCCPLRECAQHTGLNRSVELAQISFVALCKYLIESLAPDWELVKPTAEDDIPIHKIIVAPASNIQP
ncbi:MAG: hypothetical protein JSW42_01910 [Chloroflexota bacterium]|nr:MAG: hypothetical protein JSW42_01910 [Chloroflexota bacterium]